MSDSYKKINGEEIMIGKNLNSQWTVSCWDKDLELRWEKQFYNELDARVEFERWRN